MIRPFRNRIQAGISRWVFVYIPYGGTYYNRYTIDTAFVNVSRCKEHMGMKRTWIIIVALGAMGWFSSAIAQEQDAAVSPSETPTSAPSSPETAATTQESGEYELPEGPEGLVAKVGDTEILTADLTAILDKVPYRLSKKKRQLWETSLAAMIFSALEHSFLEANKIPEAPNELAELKNKLSEEVEKFNQTASLRLLPEMTVADLMERRGLNNQRLNDMARYEKLIATMITNEELLSFISKHPNYFNGTKVLVGHILIPSSPLAPTAEQKKAIEQLQTIAADIRAGKTTFDAAAHEFSKCPSAQTKGLDGTGHYGDLGDVNFGQLAAAYGAAVGMAALDSDVGAISDVVRSNMGFHLLKVYTKTEGSDPRGAEAANIARMGVSNLVENQVYNQALDRAPIIIYKAAKKAPRPEEE